MHTRPEGQFTVELQADKGEGRENPWKNVGGRKSNSTNRYDPHIIAQSNAQRTRREQRVAKNGGKEAAGPSNRFGHLMADDPGNLQVSLQVAPHNSPPVDRAAIKCSTVQAKKQKLDKGPRNVTFPQ